MWSSRSTATFDVVVLNNSHVKAEKNYWGESPPNSNHFSVDATSELDADLHLPSCVPPGAPGGGGKNGNLYGVLNSILLDEALNQRSAGNYAVAFSLLQEIIGDETNSLETREWALTEAFACAQSMPGSRMSSYFESLRDAFPALGRRTDFLLPHLYLFEGDRARGIATFDENIRRFPRSEMERDGLYGKFLHALYTEHDTVASRTLLNSLSRLYPESDEALIAAQQLDYFVAGTSIVFERGVGSGESPKGLVPSEFVLHQNYPNPFNPSTTIQYDLPADANVSLKVYDMLGREVLSLLDGFETAGYHQTTVDGTKLASGVYFYRIRAGSFTDVKKLLLLK